MKQVRPLVPQATNFRMPPTLNRVTEFTNSPYEYSGLAIRDDSTQRAPKEEIQR